jgi:Tol biopolymer transport system component/predicted Ser/Thr protein kinase
MNPQIQSIAHYRITAKLGEGGMGEVYRATDTKLGREVAIKVLPESFAQDPGRMARFEREAQVLASLNHPNIAQIYGVEDRALVMELVEGETLAGPLRLETALDYARQVAQALEYAHERGVIHRDLKPANIKVTPEGTVKLLDFGLAKAIEDPRGTGEDPSQSPTLTLGATRMGVILGTAAYMSPDQASGRTADRRADIWSFGAVLYEMLAGKKAFAGESVSDTLASVLKVEPEWDALPRDTPAPIRTLVRRCLTKDRKQRLQAIGEARIALEQPWTEAAPAQAKARAKAWMTWAVAAVLAVATAAFGYVAYRHAAEPAPRVTRLSLLPPENGSIFTADSLFSVSPDGREVVFPATVGGKSSLWVRSLDSLTARPLAGTDGAAYPFWSPDSRSVGFFADGKLKRIELASSSVVTLCDAGPGRGASWSPNGVIIFAPGALTGISRVFEAGGTATPVTVLDAAAGENAHRYPWFLPDGRHFLYTARNLNREKSVLYLADIEANDVRKTQRAILSVNSNVVYAPPGYLLFARDQTLMAQPFDAAKGRVAGDPQPIADRLSYVNLNILGAFSVSQNGVLAYLSGSLFGEQLTWVDRSGKELGVVSRSGFHQWPSLSPDGKTVVVDRVDLRSAAFDVWLLNPERGTETRLTFGPRSGRFPIWSPDGSRVAFLGPRSANETIYQRSTSGAARDEVVDTVPAPAGGRPQDWSHDGRYLVEQRFGAKTAVDIWVLPLFGDRKAFPYLNSN